jgi:hypothetical protein
MATKVKEKSLPKYEVGSVELEGFLQSGYQDMSREKAETIIRERKANPASWPYEQFERAQAFLSALLTAPTVVSNRPGWKREKR